MYTLYCTHCTVHPGQLGELTLKLVTLYCTVHPGQLGELILQLVRLFSYDPPFQSIYQWWPERTSLEFPGVKLRLRFTTEAGLQEFVRGLKQVWENKRGVRLEVENIF